MAKFETPPYFHFYPTDFSADGKVDAMQNDQVGAYIRLLCKAWYEDPPATIPDDDRTLAMWARMGQDEWARNKEIILGPFKRMETESGPRLIQKRLYHERIKLEAYLKNQSRAGKKGAESRWGTGREIPRENGNAMATLIQSQWRDDGISNTNTNTNKELKAWPKTAAFPELPSKEEIAESSEPRIDEITDIMAEAIYRFGIFGKVNAFVNKERKASRNRRAILHVLCRLWVNKPDDPWAYAEKIMQAENGNFNEADATK